MRPLLLTLKLLCVGDAGTSHYILATGGREVVYPTQNPYAVDAIIAGQCAVEVRGLTTLHNAREVQNGRVVNHEKAAIGIAVAAVAIRGFAVAHNLRAIQQHQGGR